MQAVAVEEVQQLQSSGRPLSVEASKALGYKDVLALLAGEITLKETIVRVQTHSRNYAKRQMTWFRHLPQCRPVSKDLTWALWRPKMKS